CFDIREKERRRKQLDETQVLTVGAIMAGLADSSDRRQLLQEILDMVSTLPPSQREAVYLKFHDGFSYKEISRITGHSISNVGFLIHAALEGIRQRVQPQDRPGRVSARRVP